MILTTVGRGGKIEKYNSKLFERKQKKEMVKKIQHLNHGRKQSN
jgi:hypothetical protein